MSNNSAAKAGNELFVKEGAKQELSIRKDSEHSFSVISTSGTCFYTGTKEACADRINELLTYAYCG